MKKLIDKIAYYEDFQVFHGEIDGITEKGFDFVAPSSIHSAVTTFAYGKALSRRCVDISNGERLIVRVDLSENDKNKRSFFLKLTACLLDWEKYENDLSITINGIPVYEDKHVFFENVNLGWPTQYMPIACEFLKEGENQIVLQTENASGGGLLVSIVDLVSLPAFEEFTQISSLRYVRKGKKYAVAVYGGNDWKIKNLEKCELEEIVYANEKQIVLFRFKATQLGIAKCVCECGEKELTLTLPECVDGEDECLIGTDSDDHRHDDTLETDFILWHFLLSGLGDYYQFRPQGKRNYLQLSSQENWRKRIELLKAFDVTIGLSDCDKVMSFVENFAGDNYLGKHIHEPYLFFYRGLQDYPEEQAKYFIDGNILDRSESYGESKRAYLTALEKTYNHNAKGFKGLSSVGSPSLLCVYEANKFDRVTIEPVSCIPLLVGAVRGTTNNGFWGSHVPVDWYFGSPNDEVKSKKFLLAMQYLYISGAKYIYVESGLYKTNAFSREDWESEFCRRNRAYLRDFYDYTLKNPRKGEIKSDLAVVYGNNEYFMWQADERIAELPENDNWDLQMWGKWTDNRSQKYWRAIDAWLPPSEKQNTIDDALNLRLFTGTPYGNVDIIPYESQYSNYKTIAFLGWNTYQEGLAEKLLAFVKAGGNVFLSYCHLNKTDRPDKEFVYADSPIFKELFGCTFAGITKSGEQVCVENGLPVALSHSQSVVKCENINAKVVAKDEYDNAIVLEHSIGNGRVYFSSIADYCDDDGVVKIMQMIMERMAERSADIVCDNKNIAFTERVLSDGSRELHLLNTSCASEEKAEFTLIVTKNGERKIIKETLSPCEILRIKI